MRRPLWTFAAAVLCVLLVGCADDTPTQGTNAAALASNPVPKNYAMSTLALPPFSTTGAALAINDSGWVVGWTDSTGGSYGGRAPTLWRPGRAPLRLSVDAAFYYGGTATDINTAGDIVGYANRIGVAYGAGVGFAWNSRGTQLLGPLNGFTPLGLNDAGLMEGALCDAQCETSSRTLAGGAGPRLRCPGPLYGALQCFTSKATSVNSYGQVVGTYTDLQGGGPSHAIFWNANGSLLDLMQVSGAATAATATHVNQNKSVSGSLDIGGTVRPVVWYVATGTWRTFGNGIVGTATSISDRNRVVGTVATSRRQSAFTATTDTDFGTLPVPVCFSNSSAADVNTCGAIVGAVTTLSGVSLPALWQVTGGLPCDVTQPPPVNVRVGHRADDASTAIRSPGNY
jgi:hypothetical protein